MSTALTEIHAFLGGGTVLQKSDLPCTEARESLKISKQTMGSQRGPQFLAPRKGLRKYKLYVP
jgi:hypothetical protein